MIILVLQGRRVSTKYNAASGLYIVERVRKDLTIHSIMPSQKILEDQETTGQDAAMEKSEERRTFSEYYRCSAYSAPSEYWGHASLGQ